MGLGRRGSWLPPLLCLVALLLPLEASGDASSDLSVRFIKVPLPVSALASASFGFEVLGGRNGGLCSDCSLNCKLDNYSSADCKSREMSYTGLHDGDHTFEVCINGSRGIRCASYNWTVDTVPPTAYVSATSFTNMSNVSVNISFSEPCNGGGGFRCSPSDCSLLVYGAGHVSLSTIKVLQPSLEYSVMVAISADVLYGRLVLVMDKNFCTDAAGNSFVRTSNSRFFLHFDRRNVSLNLKTRIPDKLLHLNGEMRVAKATNNRHHLRVYLYFSEPVLNSSAEILDVIHSTSGLLSPLNGNSLGNRRFGYMVNNLSSIAVVTITCESNSIISRQGTPVSLSDPLTFLYDAQRPSVRLGTTSNMRTREHDIPVLIKFVKPVFGFNSSAIIISGGHLLSFLEISKSIYSLQIHADDGFVSVEVPENTVSDVAGNKNLPSNKLQVRHYSVPLISALISTITTILFVATSMAAAALSISTARLLSSGAFSRLSGYLISEPSRNLLRIACHIQVFALSRWLAVTLPIEYYEFARGLEWSIPYVTLPWETGGIDSFTKDSSLPTVTYSKVSERSNLLAFESFPLRNGSLGNSSVYGTPLTPIEYRSFLENQNMKPEAEFIMNSRNFDRWKYFGRNMFWLAIIGGGLLILHATLVFIIKLRRKKSEKQREFGALVFPRFEVFLILLALPCICQASATIIRGETAAGIAVGIVLLGVSSLVLLSLLAFLSLGITLGKLLRYKEVHQERQESHWYQELIRATLGPGKRGQWTWRDQPNSIRLTQLGPLFEDLRGPPKYMLSQFSSSGTRGKPSADDRIIASEDENEDTEAPFIQKLFGILRIYYTLLETVKRVALGILVGACSADRPSKGPTIVILSITSFQLFVLLLKKPFIKKRVQLVEIISVASEVGVFAAFIILFENDFSDSRERRVGLIMLAFFAIGFVAQLISEWYSLYQQVIRLSPGRDSFSLGLRMALNGLLLLVLPSGLLKGLGEDISNQGEGEREGGRSSSSSDKPWMRQLRELAKASFSKEEGAAPKDPSSSRTRFWTGKRSRSSSMASSADSKAKGDLKAKSKGLYKDLEAIFSSK